MTSFWWDRGRFCRPEAPALQAVIFSLDGVLGDTCFDEELFRESVWALHCAGIRVAIVTGANRPQVQRPVRELLGDGAVEVMITGDEVSRAKPDPEVYHQVLWELGVRADEAMAVEDSVDGLRAALDAGLATIIVTTERTRDDDFSGATAVLAAGAEPLSAHHCRGLLTSSR